MGFRYDDVVARHPELKKVPLVGVIKEVAPFFTALLMEMGLVGMSLQSEESRLF